jgi:hypothetical protein
MGTLNSQQESVGGVEVQIISFNVISDVPCILQHASRQAHIALEFELFQI